MPRVGRGGARRADRLGVRRVRGERRRQPPPQPLPRVGVAAEGAGRQLPAAAAPAAAIAAQATSATTAGATDAAHAWGGRVEHPRQARWQWRNGQPYDNAAHHRGLDAAQRYRRRQRRALVGRQRCGGSVRVASSNRVGGGGVAAGAR